MKKSGFTLIEMLARPGVASKHEKRSQSRSAFTLIEMLVVIAIIALLASILVPAATKAISRAQSLQCMNNMRGLGQSMIQYLTIKETQVLPMAFDDSQPNGQKAWSYRLLEAGIFPEYGSVGELLRKNESFHCPSDKGPGEDKPSFAMNTYISSGTYITTIPKHSQTILFAEVWGRRDNKGYTKVDPNKEFAAFDRHDGKANYAFLDGHVDTLKATEDNDEDRLALWRPDL